MEPGEHVAILEAALALEGEAYRALFDGRSEEARDLLARASEGYRASWAVAPPRSFGRLIAMQKTAVLAGDATAAAEYALRELGDDRDSPPAWYAAAIAALVMGDDDLARSAAAGMREGDAPFQRAADAVEALADRDGERYGPALDAIVADFAAREQHLTGIAIADTALMLDRLADRRGLARRPVSPVVPAAG